jgi:hypothetical protein
MANFSSFNKVIELTGVSDNGTTLSWSDAQLNNKAGIVQDENGDGNLDIGVDHFSGSYLFTGYYYTASDGSEHPVFYFNEEVFGNHHYSVPYHTDDIDLNAELNGSGATSDKEDNFVPQGSPDPESHSYTDTIRLTVSSDDGTTLTWTAILPQNTARTIVDQNADGDLDIGTDGSDTPNWSFSGYYYTALNGTEHPIYESLDDGFYYIP